MSQNGTNDSRDFELAPSKPPKRRLVVMFDGTGKTRQSMTNIARMFEAIDDSHPESYKRVGSGSEDSKAHEGPAPTGVVQCGTCNQLMLEQAEHEGHDSKANIRAGVPCGSCHQLVVEPELQPVQLVKYIPGVGKDRKGLVAWLSSQRLGLVGYNLSDKMIEGYTWLCKNYESEEDHVFVFGFSQGAFAARSLVSLLDKCDGVIKKKDYVGEDQEKKKQRAMDHMKAIENAYTHYRECVKSTKVEDEDKLKKGFTTYLAKHEDAIIRLKVQVKMLGVWDTIGVSGLPKTCVSTIDNSNISRTQYQFHEQGLSSIVDNAYHALALDECLQTLEPSLWTSRAFLKQEVKQVWFAGSQSNVGGGADLDDNDHPDDLWEYSYVWMQRHAEKHGLRFYWSFESPATRQADSRMASRLSLRKPRPSSKNFVLGLYSCLVNRYIRRPDPTLAMLHWSVLRRMKVGEENQLEAENNHESGPTLLHKIMCLFFNMISWTDYGRTSEGVGSRRPKPTGYLIPKSLVGIHTSCHTHDEFLETEIPEDSTVVTAPDQVDVKGTPKMAAPKWHIETDDVWKKPQWTLPLYQEGKKEEEKEEGKEKEAKKVE